MLLEQSLHRSSIGCIEIIHFDILDMKRYDFLMKNMALDVLCTPPPPTLHQMSVLWIFEGRVFAKIHPRAAAFSVKHKFSFAWFQCASHYACHKTFLLAFSFGNERWLQVPRLSRPAAPHKVSGHPSPCLAKWRPNI